ncbi:hypothetical protein DITRI_Ditri01bG0174400 [Diplodiscus trichospermus]
MELFLLMPAGLFTCMTLVTLKLQMENSFVLKILRNVSLPSLKNHLYLELIEFSDDDSIERLFSSCSVLEELVLQTYVDFGPVLNSVFHDSGATDMIKGICHVQSLHLSGPFSDALFCHGPISVLGNMTDLKISRCNPEGWERVLNFAPCLETLVFEELPCFRGNTTNPPKEVPPCLMSQIKVIKFLLFRGMKSEMRMVEYFLKHAQVLESLVIHMIVRMNQRLKITRELLKFPGVSMKCQVVIV